MSTYEGHWVDDLNPVLIPITSTFGIHWYGLAYLAGLLFGYSLLVRWIHQHRSPLASKDQAMDFMVWAGVGMLVGGRVGYMVFYNLPELIAHPISLFKINQGGMASHGGIIGLIIGTIWFAKRHKLSFLVLMDMIAAAGPLGIGLGRIANFVNGELWGRPSTIPWAVIFPKSIPVPPGLGDEAQVHAFQLANLNLAVPRHPSQLYAAVIEGFLLFAILVVIHARHRRPGLTGGMFCILYGIGRFCDEFFREPDVGQPGSPDHAALLGFMSKGQAYTLPFIILGIVILIRALRLPPRPDLYVPPGPPPAAPANITTISTDKVGLSQGAQRT